MANPAKRKASGTGDDTAGGTTGGEGSGSGRSEPIASKRVAPTKRSASGPSRYTPPSPRAHRRPSPRWVPALMFALWIVGLLLIILNYMELLPGSDPNGNGWYLVAGLASILGGIMVATQYH